MAIKTPARTWTDMSHDERKRAVTAGRADGLSDEQIGDRYGATKGMIVGFRHRHLPQLTGKSPEEIEVPEMPKKERSPSKRTKAPQAPRSAPEITRPKMAASEATQCTHIDPDTGHRCGFEFEDATTHRCRKHPLR